jgi:hypothetical protein
VTLPGTNSVLTAVEAPGSLDRTGRPTAAGAPVWTGAAPGFLVRREQLLEQGKAQDEQRELRTRDHTLTLFRIDGAPMTEIAGPDSTAQTIVLEDMRTGTAIRRRWTIVGTELVANGLDADHVVLHLDNPTPTS